MPQWLLTSFINSTQPWSTHASPLSCSYLLGHIHFIQLKTFTSTSSPITKGVAQSSSCGLPYMIIFSSKISVPWFTLIFLKLNRDKTEILLVGSKSALSKNSFSLTFDSSTVSPYSLGVILNSLLSFLWHINITLHTYHLQKINHLYPCPTSHSTSISVHSLVISCTDF